VVWSHPVTTEPVGMTRPAVCYRLLVDGRPSRLLVDTIDDRFGDAASVRPSGEDTEVLLFADQASLRALLTLIWDVGRELGAVTACTARHDRRATSPPTAGRRHDLDQDVTCACGRGTS
jgi:hypothetical protein